MTSPMEAACIAEELLAKPLPRRWRHTQGVAAAARSIRHLAGPAGDTLEVAAWLHDIGYSPTIAKTGFHPLDGARELLARGVGDALVRALIAQHTGAWAEAEERGLDAELHHEFPIDKESRLLHLLAYCDLATDPIGNPISPQQRILDVFDRYPDDHPVHRAMLRSSATLLRSSDQVATPSPLSAVHELGVDSSSAGSPTIQCIRVTHDQGP